MSAFFIAINRNRSPFDRAVAEAMMTQLDRFGHDAKQLTVKDHYAIGFQSHWTVPEEQGERQPLQVSESQWFVFYGRLDNRESLLNELAKPLDLNVSDAALAQTYLESFGSGRLADFIGPFVLLSFDAQTDSLLLARDGMGARSLSYKIDENYVLAASYEMALVGHPSVDYRLNDQTVGLHMVSQMQLGPSSMISGLEMLHAGHFLYLNKKELKQKRFYAPDPKRRVTFKTDDEYAVEFRRLLTQSVTRRLRCHGDLGTQLSGGMDSIPVTILAANEGSKKAVALSAYSWVFDEYPDADERKYSSPLCKKLGIEQIMVNCDSLWLSYDEKVELDPLGPIYNPFMTYNNELFKQAQTHKVKVMLNGIHGDILYGYTQGILYELLRAGDIRGVFAEARSLLVSSGSIKSFVKDFILKPLPIVSRLLKWRTPRNSLLDNALQAQIVDQLETRESPVDYLVKESRKALRPQQWQVVLGDFAGRDASTGRFLESEYAIERRYPFRDRDLCEFMLAIPSKYLAFSGVKRPIVKRAFTADFSAELLHRNAKAYFEDVTLNGLRNDKLNAAWANAGAREWSYYVKECYFDGKVEQNHLLDVVKWRCGYYDYWKSVCYYPMAKQLGLSNETTK